MGKKISKFLAPLRGPRGTLNWALRQNIEKSLDSYSLPHQSDGNIGRAVDLLLVLNNAK